MAKVRVRKPYDRSIVTGINFLRVETVGVHSLTAKEEVIVLTRANHAYLTPGRVRRLHEWLGQWLKWQEQEQKKES
jgi:hypothetical protein